MTKNLLIKIICGVALILVFMPQSFVWAGNYIWEVPLPGVSIQQLNNLTGFGDLVNILVRLAYRIAMLFMLYKLIVIGYKYMTNQGNADVVKTVSDGLKNVIFGALILFGSYIILYTINPQLTKFPQQLYCDTNSGLCGKKSESKSGTQVYVKCTDVNMKAEDEKNLVGGDIANQITEFEEDYKDQLILNHGDWSSAKSDLKNRNASDNIWEAIKTITGLRALWYNEKCGKLLWGPIALNHADPEPNEDGTFTSCHPTGEAIDLVVYDKDGNDSVNCTKAFLQYLNGRVANVRLCDETWASQPHIHLYDINCTVAGCAVE